MQQTASLLHENLQLIEVASPFLLDTMLSDRRTAPLILTRLSDRVAVVAPGKLDMLLGRLRKLGHLPKVQ